MRAGNDDDVLRLDTLPAARRGFARAAVDRDPAEVARAVAEQIAMPSGTRPLRSRLGGGDVPIEPLNAQTARTQAEVLDVLGFPEAARLTR